MKYSKIISSLLLLGAVKAETFCNSAEHLGKSVEVTNNQEGDINGINYELWAESGSKSAIFYEDGSFSCTFQNARDIMCHSGLSFDDPQSLDQIGHLYADFKLVKGEVSEVDYSVIGAYGISQDPYIEFFIVDNWLTADPPEDWIGNKNYGEFTIDGATYTVYENTPEGPTIDMEGIVTKQIFSVRKEARDCGRIDVTAHINQWEQLGMTLGKLEAVKVLVEADNSEQEISGTVDVPYAIVFINNNTYEPITVKEPVVDEPVVNEPVVNEPVVNEPVVNEPVVNEPVVNEPVVNEPVVNEPVVNEPVVNEPVVDEPIVDEPVVDEPVVNTPSTCPASITEQGYPCCSSSKCVVVYVDEDGDWGVENGDWCGCIHNDTVTTTTTTTTTATSEPSAVSIETNFCTNAEHTGQNIELSNNRIGTINDVDYELWSDGGSNSATFYEDGSFSCSFQNTFDMMCHSGHIFGISQPLNKIGQIYAHYKFAKKDTQNVDFSFMGVFGWSNNSHIEFFIVDNWLTSDRPGDWIGNKKYGDFTIDGATYTVYEKTPQGPTIDIEGIPTKQYISVRKEARECGTIDVTAHFQQWEKLGMKIDTIDAIKVFVEASSDRSGTSGNVDISYAKIYTQEINF